VEVAGLNLGQKAWAAVHARDERTVDVKRNIQYSTVHATITTYCTVAVIKRWFGQKGRGSDKEPCLREPEVRKPRKKRAMPAHVLYWTV
jgi:hypothetical protein